jgi:thiol-disulfide isomerase/thioredoxin
MPLRSLALFVALICSALAACQKPTTNAPATSAQVANPSPPAATGPATSPPADKPAIPTLVIDTFDGKKYNLADHRGHWVVVNFWATWCNPCLKELPDLDAFDAARDDVDVVGLSYEEIEHADMAAFLKEHVVHYPIAVLDVYKPPADFDTPRGLPMTYLIAPDGKVAKKFLGPVTTKDLEIFIREAAASLHTKPAA